jgi:hypothetical protein
MLALQGESKRLPVKEDTLGDALLYSGAWAKNQDLKFRIRNIRGGCGRVLSGKDS